MTSKPYSRSTPNLNSTWQSSLSALSYNQPMFLDGAEGDKYDLLLSDDDNVDDDVSGTADDDGDMDEDSCDSLGW